MAEQAVRVLPRIAFVFGDATLAEHVRDAVAGQAEITYAVPAGDFDAARLASAHVTAALVNVDGGDWLDDIEARLDAAGVPVVFNDPDYSKGLEGWDRARWVRHLAAKLRGSDDFDPPRPPVPDPAPAAADAPAADAEAVALAAAASPVSAPATVAPASPAAAPAAVVPGAATLLQQPLSAHEIESMTADFVAVPAPQVAATSAWHAVSASLQVAPAPPPSQPDPPTDAAPVAASMAAAMPADAPAAPDAPTPDADLLDVDTEELSAMIDARLAEPEPEPVAGTALAWDAPAATGDSAGAAAWEPPAATTEGAPASAAADTPAEPAAPAGAATTAAVDPDADVLASLPSLDDWELVDADAAPAAAHPHQPAVEPEFPDSLAGLTLVPIDPTGPAASNTMEPIERWIDASANRSKPKGDGDKA